MANCFKPEQSECACVLCTRAEGRVRAAIAEALTEIVSYLERSDFKKARSYTEGFVRILANMPESTAEMLGTSLAADLRARAARGFEEIEKRDRDAALAVFQQALGEWASSHPQQTM